MADAWGGAFGDAFGASFGASTEQDWDAWGGSFNVAWGESFGPTTELPVPPDALVQAGSGPGWNIDFTGIENRIAEERADKEDRRRAIERVFRRATGQPLPDDKPAEQVGAEMLSAVKPAARKRMQAEIRAIAEIDASIARLEKQIEAADMAYLLAEERDIVWIVSEYI